MLVVGKSEIILTVTVILGAEAELVFMTLLLFLINQLRNLGLLELLLAFVVAQEDLLYKFEAGEGHPWWAIGVKAGLFFRILRCP